MQRTDRLLLFLLLFNVNIHHFSASHHFILAPHTTNNSSPFHQAKTSSSWVLLWFLMAKLATSFVFRCIFAPFTAFFTPTRVNATHDCTFIESLYSTFPKWDLLNLETTHTRDDEQNHAWINARRTAGWWVSLRPPWRRAGLDLHSVRPPSMHFERAPQQTPKPPTPPPYQTPWVVRCPLFITTLPHPW